MRKIYTLMFREEKSHFLFLGFFSTFSTSNEFKKLVNSGNIIIFRKLCQNTIFGMGFKKKKKLEVEIRKSIFLGRVSQTVPLIHKVDNFKVKTPRLEACNLLGFWNVLS